MYDKKALDSCFYKSKAFYVFFIPIAVPYSRIYQRAETAGLTKTQKHGPILEKGKLFGFGWIGVEVQKPTHPRDDVVHVHGNFDVYEHKGPYRTLGNAYKKIRKDRPDLKETYNLYLDDPTKTKPEDCRTEIYLR